MVIGERERRELQEALMEAIGPDRTDTLMAHLPPVGWADVATARDLYGVRNELQGEIAALRSEIRGEMASLAGDLRGEMGAMRAEFHHELRLQFYWLVALLIAILLAVLGTGLTR